MDKITLKDFKNAVKVAVKEFGEYSFSDKGARDVMDVPHWINKLKKLNNVDAHKIVIALYKGNTFESMLAQDLVTGMQDNPQFMQMKDIEDILYE